jgi:hypothetical protein
MLYERRSPFFTRLFDHLGIAYAQTPAGQIDPSQVLQWDGKSLKLYFNDATDAGGAHFIASKTLYSDYLWRLHWLKVRSERCGFEHYKVIPYPGEEYHALNDLLRHLRNTARVSPTLRANDGKKGRTLI